MLYQLNYTRGSSRCLVPEEGPNVYSFCAAKPLLDLVYLFSNSRFFLPFFLFVPGDQGGVQKLASVCSCGTPSSILRVLGGAIDWLID